MEMFCPTGAESSEAAIFQCPMVANFGLRASEGILESTTLRTRNHTINSGIANNKDNSYSAKGVKDLDKCNNINYRNNNINKTANIGGDVSKIITNYSTNHPKRNIKGNEVPVSPRMAELLKGLDEPGDSNNLPETPVWLDQELFNRGRQFYQKFLFCIFFSDLLSLLMMFSISRILKPLIYTDRSDTPTRALRRYVSTIMHIITWFTGDVWDPNNQAHKDILRVRSIHNKSANIFNSSKHYDSVTNTTVKSKGHIEPSCPFSPALRQDLQTQTKPGLSYESPDNPTLYINQWDMAITQYSFLGIILAHPYRMGAWWATEKDLEGLVHFWRGIGWLLGIEDKYNFCSGTVAETKALCIEMEKRIMVPSLAEAGWNHEHMSTCLISGINQMVPALSYPPMFRFLADTLGVSIPAFNRQMTFKHTFQYWLLRFVFHVLFLVPGVIFIFNELLKISIRLIQKENPTWFAKLNKPEVTVSPHEYT